MEEKYERFLKSYGKIVSLPEHPASGCVATGACFGLTPSQVIAKLRNDAAAQPKSYGFTYFSNSPNDTTRYYGHLGYAGGY